MIDVALVGAGLCGLTLARQLQQQGASVALYEARERAGGRILTHHAPLGGAAIDLGASWYWPDTEPRITALVASLGLRTFAQPDAGQVLHLADVNEGPQVMDVPGIHGGARRLSGGMASLIQALLASLKPDTLKTGHKLVALMDQGSHIELQFTRPAQGATSGATDGVTHIERVQARQVVLAMPPRLIAQNVRFSPALPEATLHAMNDVATWMAREAKAVARFERPFWLEQGQSGSGFVSHAQAVLREVWDASDERGAALAGFCAMAPATRQQFARSLALLSASQFAQLFGRMASTAGPEDIVIEDWATQPLTCSELDKRDQHSRPPVADPVLRRPHWSGRLHFGGTETALEAAGHMEGALASAARLADALRPAPPEAQPEAAAAALDAFRAWVSAERAQALPRYQQHLRQRLSRQDSDRVTQRALLATVEHTYAQALAQLATLPWPLRGAGEQPGQHQPLHTPGHLAAPWLAGFSGFSKALVDDALAFNAGSCALSNFAQEHRPDTDYLRAITADLAAAWREFALATHDLIQARSQGLAAPQAH